MSLPTANDPAPIRRICISRPAFRISADSPGSNGFAPRAAATGVGGRRNGEVMVSRDNQVMAWPFCAGTQRSPSQRGRIG